MLDKIIDIVGKIVLIVFIVLACAVMLYAICLFIRGGYELLRILM